jgi:hypothetical protein
MVLDDDEIEKRLHSEENVCNLIVKEIPKGGRGVGDPNIPPAIRNLIGMITATGDESQKSVGEEFGVTQAVTSVVSRGLIGATGKERVDNELLDIVSKAREKKTGEAHDLAMDALLGTLGTLNEQFADPVTRKFVKPQVLSKIATDMSKVVSNLKDKDASGVVNNTQVVLFAPPMRKESYYDFQDV